MSFSFDDLFDLSDVEELLQASGCELAFISLLAGENDFRYICEANVIMDT